MVLRVRFWILEGCVLVLDEGVEAVGERMEDFVECGDRCDAGEGVKVVGCAGGEGW